MHLFFSPKVRAYQVLAPHFQACETVEKLIQTNSVQFELNCFDDPNDPFFHIHSRVKGLRSKVTKMLDEIENKYNEHITDLTADEKKITLLKMKEEMRNKKMEHLRYLDHEQQWLEERIHRFNEFSNNYDTFLIGQQKLEQELDTLRAKIEATQRGQVLEEFIMITGVCNNKNISSIQRILFRQSKGHSVMVFSPRERKPSTSVFLCLINKNIYKHIGPKLTKSCELNQVNLYQLPNTLKGLHEYEQTMIRKIREAEEVLEMSGRQLTAVMHESLVGEGISMKEHLLRVCYLQKIINIICHSKQIGDPPNHVLITFHMPSQIPMPRTPVPIFPLSDQKVKQRTMMPRLACLEEVNIMTELFSIPNHNEIIPSVFMMMTVPFLFGMMFSDFGHGILLLLATYAFKLNVIFYLMAFMSMYCGFIYNQFFGMKVFRFTGIGIVEPVWAVSENGLNFENSLKMKMSMIMAFFHMGFGMVLKIVNQKRRGEHRKILLDSLPKLFLLFTTVGYLVVLIVAKWMTNFSGKQSTAPSIINSILELYLGWNKDRKASILGSIETEHYIGSLLNKINIGLILVLVYNQTIRQRVEGLLKALFRTGKRVRRSQYNDINEEEERTDLDFQISEDLSHEAERSLEDLNSTDVQQHSQSQSHDGLGPLQTFQFVLSLISSTTSYLRLFALSLAHAKLSGLILDMLLSTLSEPHPYISYIRCIGFFCITIGMMLTLDVMECMMHVVRLHWVEWMGKFYSGNGKLFTPENQYALT